ncbi:methyl-accepting chemotaxis protein [Leadbettera azotonutricia]|uniref:Methyl-accepting chemotaxis protein n=1 Tax=Leadbettera azotonutricia (strain ATCC BAA-888 / DSM 13862 / ZAS-9) TaxID=545695 RepID=F5YG86_LEAAZ|nr:methyl-accepting chemotaxis protein [Leadbettera azotonutricia]AEF82133.1 methyl-accepting chemotaxis protein [Leadbettera azotonutricia ZAS-9]
MKISSMKNKVLFFSIIVYLLILGGSILALLVTARHIVGASVSQQLVQAGETKKLGLQSSVNSEMTLAMKMADSPIIKRHFLNPHDEEVKALAFEEIAGYRRAFASNSTFWASDADKDFYSDDAYSYTVNPDDPADYWYKMTLYETDKYNFNINYNDNLKKTMLWVNAPVFNGTGTNKTPIGLVGTGIVLSDFVDSQFSGLDSGITMYFYNSAFEITGSTDQNLIINKKKITDQDPEIASQLDSFKGKISGGEYKIFSVGNTEYFITHVDMLDWDMVLSMPVSSAMLLESPITSLAIIMLAVILAVFVICNVYVRFMLNPLGDLRQYMAVIAEGDFTRSFPYKKDDEIGDLVHYFNELVEKIRSLVGAIKQQVGALRSISDELSTRMGQTAAAINEITATIGSIKDRVINQSASVTETNATMGQISGNIAKLNGHVEKQTESVSQSSSAIEEMLANIESVTRTLVKNAENVTSLAEASEVGRGGLQEVAADIQEIAKESEGILEINGVMENIASQTNLLSMNAAIEAAHAGEAGKGFAVVADEIRKLAENSSEQSKTISGVLKKMKAAIEKITGSTDAVLNKFEAIDTQVKTVSDQEGNIRNAMEEQSAGSKQILDAISKLHELTQLVKGGSEEMLTGSGEIIKEGVNLEKASSEISGGMNEMASGADLINTAVIDVNQISGKNKESIEVLVKEISWFKVE